MRRFKCSVKFQTSILKNDRKSKESALNPFSHPPHRIARSLLLAFHGFDDDPRELHCIPEVRRFVREFRRIWPYWLYFCC
jgi:hypothetical protein